jgi:hypothetical protein
MGRWATLFGPQPPIRGVGMVDFTCKDGIFLGGGPEYSSHIARSHGPERSPKDGHYREEVSAGGDRQVLYL